MKTRRSTKEIILEVATQNKQDEEMEEGMVLKVCLDESIEEETLTYENLIMCYWTKITLPSSLWAVHKEPSGKFIIFSCLSENTSDTFVSTEKVIMFEGSLKANIFVRGGKVEPSSLLQQNVETVEMMDALLKKVDELELCQGTGLENAPYSPECCLILDRKYRNARCSNCATKRTLLKKTEAQRLRRAAAKQKEPTKNTVGSHKQSRKEEMEYLDDKATEMEDFFDNQDQHFIEEGDNEEMQDIDESEYDG